MPNSVHVPKLCRHKRSGRAFVYINRKPVYLGAWGSDEARQAYDRLIGEWLVAGRRLPTDSDLLTFEELADRFLEWADERYVKNGRPTGWQATLELALREPRRLYGTTPAGAFSPLALEALIHRWERSGLKRSTVWKYAKAVRRMYRWGIRKELVQPATLEALRAVELPRRGHSPAPEGEPVQPVDLEAVEAIRPFVSRQVAAIIDLQLYTAARPGEVVGLRPCDITLSGEVWHVRLEEHKTAHHNKARVLLLGPKAQAVVQPFLPPASPRRLDQPLFSPVEAEEERRAAQHAARKTPLSCGNRPGTNRRLNPDWTPLEAYTTDSYRRAIDRACDQAFPPPPPLARVRVKGRKGRRWETREEHQHRLGPEGWQKLLAWRAAHRWSPHQLRHTAATKIRREHGVEMAQIILGHSDLRVTEIYAERDLEAAAAAMRKIG